MRNILEDIENYMQMKELVASLLLTMLFLSLSFVGYTRLSTIEITVFGRTYPVHISYYGFPCRMIGILNPLTEMESYWIYYSGQGLVRLFWDGLFLNFILYFLLAFLIVYLFRRLRG